MKLFQHPKFQNPKDCLAIKTIIVSNQIVLTKKVLYFNFSSRNFIDKADAIRILQEFRSVFRLEKLQLKLEKI